MKYKITGFVDDATPLRSKHKLSVAVNFLIAAFGALVVYCLIETAVQSRKAVTVIKQSQELFHR